MGSNPAYLLLAYVTLMFLGQNSTFTESRFRFLLNDAFLLMTMQEIMKFDDWNHDKQFHYLISQPDLLLVSTTIIIQRPIKRSTICLEQEFLCGVSPCCSLPTVWRETISIVFISNPTIQTPSQHTHTRKLLDKMFAAESHLLPPCKHKHVHMTKTQTHTKQ